MGWKAIALTPTPVMPLLKQHFLKNSLPLGVPAMGDNWGIVGEHEDGTPRGIYTHLEALLLAHPPLHLQWSKAENLICLEAPQNRPLTKIPILKSAHQIN